MKQEKQVDQYHFYLSDKLGEGSFGQVFKATNVKTKEKVALKILSKKVINSDPYLKKAFGLEIKVMQKLKSTNIVQLLDFLETSNNYYVVTQYCDGGDLQGLLDRKKKLPESEALKVLQHILNGFLDLLKNGIIHRDLKPPNILIHQGNYKIGDFGFAKMLENFQQDVIISKVGTPLYMAPQILRGQQYHSKSDIWSIGFIYYETLYGESKKKSVFKLCKLRGMAIQRIIYFKILSQNQLNSTKTLK